MTTTDTLRHLLSTGQHRELGRALAAMAPEARVKACKPLVRQARAVGSTCLETTVEEWLADLRPDYPGGHTQFVDAWEGRTSEGHWAAATTVEIASRTVERAAQVWPVPSGRAYAEWLYPALFPHDLGTFVARWSADFARTPRNVDRNAGRAVMYEWMERGLVDITAHQGAVLMLFSGWVKSPGKPLLRWLEKHPKVTAGLFTQIFTTPGVKGASLMQCDDGCDDGPMRAVVVPGLVKAGVWTHDFVVRETEAALAGDLPAYQRRWFVGLARDLGI